MYNVPIIGAMVMTEEGEAIGFVERIECDGQGIAIIVEGLADPEPGAKEPMPQPETLHQLRAVRENQ